jgi:D-alanyl-D-alanine carboxypeptidase/D-alanyl-D-alanine-endopeptidase (penicillin-binding protein 4)
VSRRTVALFAAVLAVLGGGIVAAVTTGVISLDAARPTPTPAESVAETPTPSPAPTVLAAASGAPTPGAPTLAEVLDSPLSADALGGSVAASVIDLSSGSALLTDNADAALIPASTMKILTSAAALEVLGAGHRFTTRVLQGPVRGQIGLVGGGDPTLTAEDDPDPGTATSISTLADLTAESLTEAGITEVDLYYDDTLFTGPAEDPDWRSTYVPSGDVGLVSALALDGGRLKPGLRARAADPASSAASTFATRLASHGILVQAGPTRARLEEGAAEIAAVRSPALAQIVEHVLLVSDNDGAEILGRHVALGRGKPATASDAERAVVETLEEMGIDMSGNTVRDASGLARGNAISPEVLVATLAAAARPENPHLRPVLTGLPVARFNGTLDDRFDSPRAADAAGVVRAKTGTLAGVTSLAGFVVSRDGSSYGFAVLADDIVDTEAARAAIDNVAAALVRCGCADPGTGG